MFFKEVFSFLTCCVGRLSSFVAISLSFFPLKMSKSASLRRIQADVRELALDPSDRYHAAPLEHDMLEWHFTLCGADDTDFAGGVYHGRILLPPDYPFKPPHIIFLTPTGRFETHTKICLSFSAFHPELWQPAWGIRLILEALISFLPTPADGALGALDWSSSERQKLAKQSVNFFCPTCNCCVKDLIPKLVKSDNSAPGGSAEGTSKPKSRFQKEIEELQRLQFLEHPKEDDTNAAPKAETSPPLPNNDSIIVETTGTTEMVNAATENEVSNETAPSATSKSSTLAPTLPPRNTAANCESSTHQPASARNEPQLSARKEPAALVVEPTTTTTTTTTRTDLDPAHGTIRRGEGGGQQVVVPDEALVAAAAAAAARPPIVSAAVTTTWWLDPLLHAIIVVLAILVYVWLRKVAALIVDIRNVYESAGS
jgi:ubiquitin-conjugating enzyme E2 J1